MEEWKKYFIFHQTRNKSLKKTKCSCEQSTCQMLWSLVQCTPDTLEVTEDFQCHWWRRPGFKGKYYNIWQQFHFISSWPWLWCVWIFLLLMRMFLPPWFRQGPSTSFYFCICFCNQKRLSSSFVSFPLILWVIHSAPHVCTKKENPPKEKRTYAG